MPERKIRLALVFGGQSAEHDVSLASARSMLKALDPDRYEVLPIAIGRAGDWLLGKAAVALLGAPAHSDGRNQEHPEMLLATAPETTTHLARALSPVGSRDGQPAVDVVFPLLHGPRGEDGTVQGLFELAGVPYVGTGVAGSAVGMDKILMKNLFKQAGLPVLPFLAVTRIEWRRDPAAVACRVAGTIGYPCFVKPANMGSSIGISRVDSPSDLAPALDEAARFDRRLLVEQAAPNPREIECGVLGNDDPEVSVAGEVVVGDAPFYDYEAKYEPGASDLIVPADLPADIAGRVRELARQAFLAIDAAGMARVDFFLCPDGSLYISEINTIPGFTPTSMFPRLWAASGVSYPALIDRLVQLALERHAPEQGHDRDGTRDTI